MNSHYLFGSYFFAFGISNKRLDFVLIFGFEVGNNKFGLFFLSLGLAAMTVNKRIKLFVCLRQAGLRQRWWTVQ